MEYKIKNKILSVSPYDESVPVKLLSNVFEVQMGNANRVLSSIYDCLEKTDVEDIDFIKDKDQGFKLVVDVPKETLVDIQISKVKLVEEQESY